MKYSFVSHTGETVEYEVVSQMTHDEARRFAEALDREAAVIYTGYDGSTAQQEGFQQRAKMLQTGVAIFESLVGMSPARYMELTRQSAGNALRVGEPNG